MSCPSGLRGRVAEVVEGLQMDLLSGDAAAETRARRVLAELRVAARRGHSISRDVWEHTSKLVEPQYRGSPANPSKPVLAVHTAMVGFALHQQSMEVPMHCTTQGLGHNFGWSVGRLLSQGTHAVAPTYLKFATLINAASVQDATPHFRGLIGLLRKGCVQVDYGLLASDLLALQIVTQRQPTAWEWRKQCEREFSYGGTRKEHS